MRQLTPQEMRDVVGGKRSPVKFPVKPVSGTTKTTG